MTVLSSCICLFVLQWNYGYNRHVWDIPPTWLTDGIGIDTALYSLFGFGHFFVKASLLLFYKKVTDVSRLNKAIWWTCLSISFVWLILFEWLTLYVARGHLPHFANSLSVALGCVNSLTDIVTTLLPINLLWRLRVSVRERAILISFFAVGLMACVLGVSRIIYGWFFFHHIKDVTWHYITLWTLAYTECYSAMVSRNDIPERKYNREAEKANVLGIDIREPPGTKTSPAALLHQSRRQLNLF
jgi:hypothetical protein